MGKLFDKIRRVQDKTRPFCTAIIPAAGSSARMGGQDKLLTDLLLVGITYRAGLTDLGPGETQSCYAGHFSDGSRLLFVTYAP